MATTVQSLLLRFQVGKNHTLAKMHAQPAFLETRSGQWRQW